MTYLPHSKGLSRLPAIDIPGLERKSQATGMEVSNPYWNKSKQQVNAYIESVRTRQRHIDNNSVRSTELEGEEDPGFIVLVSGYYRLDPKDEQHIDMEMPLLADMATICSSMLFSKRESTD
jgi:hypothetical protein